MSRIRPQFLDRDPWDHPAQADVLLREQPEDEEDDEEEEENVTDDEGDDEEEDEGGYSLRVAVGVSGEG